jgi:hypothetical protein
MIRIAVVVIHVAFQVEGQGGFREGSGRVQGG